MQRFAGPRAALAMMACVTVLNVMDRQLLAVLIEPIKEELGASDAAMGLLTGTSFALLHVFASVPVAIWADRGVRRSIIALGLALWSALTCLTGFARSYTEIFLIRVGVGIGEASGGGPAQSLLSDSFPVEQRSTALSIFVMGGPLGSMLAFAAGGWLGETLGWRTAFIIFGAPGLLLALMIRILVREPERGAFDAERLEGEEGQGPSAQLFPAIPVGRATRWIVTTPSMRNFVLASGLNTVGIYTILIWAVPYLDRVHDLSPSAAGARLAIASGLFTALGTLAGGPLADRMARRDIRWLAWLPALTSACVFPFGIAFAFATSGNLASLLLAPASFMAGSYFAPVFAAVQTLAAARMRALAAAALTAVNTILGLGLAPPLVGYLSDLGAASHGSDSIRYAIAALLSAHLGAAVLLLRASRTLKVDLGRPTRSTGDPP